MNASAAQVAHETVAPRPAILLGLALLAHVASIVTPPEYDFAPALASWVIAITTLGLREWRAAHLALLLALLSLRLVIEPFRAWPMYFLGPLMLYGCAAVLFPPLRRTAGWVRRGTFDLSVVLWTVATAAVSAMALVAWVRLFHPDLHDLVAGLPHAGTAALLGVGVLFAVINALMEEAIWRGVMFDALGAVHRGAVFALVVQALSFGAAHLHGFPRGAIGMGMATVYGLMLGALRIRARGMLAPVVAHVAADAVIFALLLTLR